MKSQTVEAHLRCLRSQEPVSRDEIFALANDLGSAMASLDRSADLDSSLYDIMAALKRASVSATTPAEHQAMLMLAAITFGFARAHSTFLGSTLLGRLRLWGKACPEPIVGSQGQKLGEAIAQLDIEVARQSLIEKPTLAASAFQIGERLLGEFSAHLREETTQAARANETDRLVRDHPPFAIRIAIALIPEPLFPNQLRRVIGSDDPAIETAIDHLLQTRMCTSDSAELHELYVGPVALGVLALTQAGRAKAVRYFRPVERLANGKSSGRRGGPSRAR